MSDAEKDQIFGRLSREVRALDTDLGYLKTELNRIGTNFEVTGRFLTDPKGPISLDRESVDLDVAKIFGVIAQYNEALIKRETKKAELDSLK
jgi:hypothetical protein